MAHEIEIVDGKPCFCYVGEPAWHSLGKRVLPDLTPEQMLIEAGLNWTVSKTPAYAKINGEDVFSGKHALVRSSDEKILTVISDDWNPVQNLEAFEFFNDFVMAGDMEMHTAGSLKGGTMVWALAKVNSSFSLFKGKDTVESYLLFSNPQEYGKSIDIRFTPIRVVCNNTLTLSLSQKSDMTVRLSHRKKFDPDMAKATLGIAQTKLDQYRDAAQFLSSKNYKPDTVVKYFTELYPVTGKKAGEKTDKMSRPAKTAHDLLHTQPGHEFGEGTWWQALNAVTYATDYIFGHNPDTRLTSSWYGLNRTKKIEALKKAVEFAEAA